MPKIIITNNHIIFTFVSWMTKFLITIFKAVHNLATACLSSFVSDLFFSLTHGSTGFPVQHTQSRDYGEDNGGHGWPRVKKLEKWELSGTWKLHYSCYGQAARCLKVINLDFCALTCCMQPERGHFQFPSSRTVMATLGLPVIKIPFLSSIRVPAWFLGTLEIGD